MKSIAFAVALILLIFAVPVATQIPQPASGSAQLTAAQRAAIEKELTEATKLLVADMNTLTYDNFAKFYSPEFQERIANGNITPAASGKEAFLKWVDNYRSQVAS